MCLCGGTLCHKAHCKCGCRVSRILYICTGLSWVFKYYARGFERRLVDTHSWSVCGGCEKICLCYHANCRDCYCCFDWGIPTSLMPRKELLDRFMKHSTVFVFLINWDQWNCHESECDRHQSQLILYNARLVLRTYGIPAVEVQSNLTKLGKHESGFLIQYEHLFGIINYLKVLSTIAWKMTAMKCMCVRQRVKSVVDIYMLLSSLLCYCFSSVCFPVVLGFCFFLACFSLTHCADHLFCLHSNSASSLLQKE